MTLLSDIPTDARFAVAVSGGVDSMTMLHMMVQSGIKNMYVVTVNHGIRPEARSDCDFVAEYCRGVGVECRVFEVDVPSYATEHKLSTETAARILRYRVFDGLDCDYVCLAHNADDNAETVLMHILRGSGAGGACGIRRRNGKYLRPILDMTRAQIQEYAYEHSVPYVQDSTNDDTKYTRNFIRHKVMPLLEQLNPAVKQNILRFAQNIAIDDSVLTERAERMLEQVRFDDDGAHIPVHMLQDGDYRLLKAVFARLGVHHDIESKHYLAIFDLAKNVGGKRLDLPFGFVAYNDYDHVTICLAEQTRKYRFALPFGMGTTETPLGRVCIYDHPVSGCLRIDAHKVPAEAVFRTRRKGDIFTKFGGGTKPLNRYLIDKKIPERTRDGLLLLACGSEVLAILGVEISDKLRVEDSGGSYICLLSD